MNNTISYIIGRSRTVILILLTLMIAGAVSFIDMPKEAEPDVTIPIIYVLMTHKGISPEDGERLLIRPMEKELRNIEGVKEMTARATLGQASVTLEFEAGFDKELALNDVREKVDVAKAELPEETDEPTVNEVNFSLFPVLIVGLAGDIPERALLQIANNLKDAIETVPQILEVDIAGDREDLLEILVKPEMFEMYNIDFEQLFTLVRQNNKLVAAGTFDTGAGRFPLKVPGLVETADEFLNIPVKVIDDKVIRFKDLATIRKSYVDPTGFARIGGKPAIALEIKKRTGENMIETVQAVKEILFQAAQEFPPNLEVTFFQDRSNNVKDMLRDLQNNLISAIILVMIIVVIALGVRSSLLVGLAIPASFLAGLFVLNLIGLTINIVVLFSLILVVGMLVDGAIVVTEYADRKMIEGLHRREAYVLASQRMWQPITASTLTTLVAFMPLLFWPGVVGQFMKFLPITLIATLTASLFSALIFVPTLGSLFGKPGNVDDDSFKHLNAAEAGKLDEVKGITGQYIRILSKLLKHPGLNFIVACAILVIVFVFYGFFGKGVEFFPDVEPERVNLQLRTRGNLSIHEIDKLLYDVEQRILDIPEFSTIYGRSSVNLQGQDYAEDATGVIFLEFINWKKRAKASILLDQVRDRLASLPGVIIDIRQEESGPPVGKPVNVQLSSHYPELLEAELLKFISKFNSMPALIDIEDTRNIPGIEWRLEVDREQASRFGANVDLAGNMIQFISNGLKIDDYRPIDSDDEVDIRVRYPLKDRNFSTLSNIKLPTQYGNIPLSNFLTEKPAQKVGKIDRADGKRSLSIKADIKEGFLADDQVKELQRWIKDEADMDPRVFVKYKGEDEDQKEAQEFLMRAFVIALALMAIILVTQFNSFYSAFLILTAVVFSTVGVFLGLLMLGQPFGIIMNGIGVISLAGIVVNNNIVLIDTYMRIKDSGIDTMNAVLQTCAQRLRPVLLTTITTILGLLPMVFKMNIDFFDRLVDFGAPSTQWWSQLATSVAFGLAFATILTLVLTPSLLVLGDNISKRFFKE